MKQCCGNCRYVRPRRDTDGEEFPLRCHRYPAMRMPDGDLEGYRVGVTAAHWCGEWAPANPETFSDGAVSLARFVLLGDLTAARALADKLKEDGA